MRIFLIPLREHFQPKNQPFIYPHHNDDYGVEQDFLSYLFNNSNLITHKPKEADWHYLPIFWTRWHLNHDYGKDGITELQEEVNKALLDDRKTFTICQYDDGPIVNIENTKIFLASRKSDAGYDIPLLSSAHKIPASIPPKKYLASFAGRLDTHPLRQNMDISLKNNKDIFIYDGNRGPEFFIDLLFSSYIALCPRGYGGSSFRFFEAMQAGTVPF
ncbi:MAG: exostosin family protein, partial [Nitrospira sp.]|nr:exostosin family protein [Nitrospira sp.]